MSRNCLDAESFGLVRIGMSDNDRGQCQCYLPAFATVSQYLTNGPNKLCFLEVRFFPGTRTTQLARSTCIILGIKCPTRRMLLGAYAPSCMAYLLFNATRPCSVVSNSSAFFLCPGQQHTAFSSRIARGRWAGVCATKGTRPANESSRSAPRHILAV